MERILLASDIDNTLVWTFRSNPAATVCVEKREGVEQGFMTPETARMWGAVGERVCFVPFTTRSLAQYRRIVWPDGFVPPYAVVANGAVLLKENEPVEDWHREMSVEMKEALAAALSRYEEDERFRTCRQVDDAYVYVYCQDGVPPEATGEELAQGTPLRVEVSGRKIYLLPPGLDKGAALRAFLARESFQKVYAAGDSGMDLPMLCAADVALVPKGYAWKELIPARVIECPDTAFSDFLMHTMLSETEKRGDPREV